ncbi:hypothetical protein ABGB19_03300 [Mycobacterium sp. B14F4]|uniref:hypothetical protein n=1 Tax=Mycobacterium sp. B14F4 TaxID=3153565 RepID=UPI00325F5E98
MTEVDTRFSALGAAQAFPGQLATSWGAHLVERPSIAALRRRAGSLLAPLGEVAPARSGIATRVVGYFIVEEIVDRNLQAAAGIRSGADRRRIALVRDGRGQTHLLERAVLKPIVRRPGVLEGRICIDEQAAFPWFVFYAQDDKESLRQKRWAHALDYIRYGETTDFPAREGSRRAGGVPAQRAQVIVRPIWFHVPRMAMGPGRVCWLKGRGDRHYAPVLSEGVLVPDNFLFSAPPAELQQPEAFAAVANLTWTHLMAEIYGRRGGGDGVLHTYVRELEMLPIIDPRKFSPEQSEALTSLFEPITRRAVLALDEELQQSDRQAFDQWAMRYLFGDDAIDAARTVERAIRDLTAERTQRIISGREQVRRAVRRTQFNPDPFAARAILDVGEAPSPMSLLDHLSQESLEITDIVIPPHVVTGSLQIGESLFDADTLLVGSDVVVETQSSGHARIARAILRRHADTTGPCGLPSDENEALRVAADCDAAWQQWKDEMLADILAALPGQNRARQRQLVLAAVETMTGLWPGSLTS